MVSAVRKGRSFREVARQFNVSVATVHFWFQRAQGKRLDRVDFSSQSSRPLRPKRTAIDVERLILAVRTELRQTSPLGEYGSAAIHAALRSQGIAAPPCIRTIGRVLDRHGALDGQRRMRRPPPPKGWYLPPVAAHQVDVDVFDFIEDLRIENGPLVDVLTVTSLLGRLPGAWPQTAPFTTTTTLDALVRHWRQQGLPGFAQFDNDTRFQGPHQYRDTIGRVTRLCLSLGVTPVFAPPGEYGFQASIENFNGRWQKTVWSRFHHESLDALCQRSDDCLHALRQRYASAAQLAPERIPFPSQWSLDVQKPPSGRILYLRRTNAQGQAALLGHTFEVDPRWPFRLVRSEVDLDHDRIRFFALRRRDPGCQPLLNEIEHRIPKRRFRE